MYIKLLWIESTHTFCLLPHNAPKAWPGAASCFFQTFVKSFVSLSLFPCCSHFLEHPLACLSRKLFLTLKTQPVITLSRHLELLLGCGFNFCALPSLPRSPHCVSVLSEESVGTSLNSGSCWCLFICRSLCGEVTHCQHSTWLLALLTSCRVRGHTERGVRKSRCSFCASVIQIQQGSRMIESARLGSGTDGSAVKNIRCPCRRPCSIPSIHMVVFNYL